MARNLLKFGALEAKKTAFFLCDIQEMFRPKIRYFDEVCTTANKMIEGAKIFKIPVYVSEYDTATFGPTAVDIDISEATYVYSKDDFSMYNDKLKGLLKKDVPELNSVVVFGIATHVCIEQTVIDLLKQDINVHVLADGVSSRSLLDRSLALQRFQSMGCILGTAESVLLKFLPNKNHPAHDQVSKLIRSKPTPDFGCS